MLLGAEGYGSCSTSQILGVWWGVCPRSCRTALGLGSGFLLRRDRLRIGIVIVVSLCPYIWGANGLTFNAAPGTDMYKMLLGEDKDLLSNRLSGWDTNPSSNLNLSRKLGGVQNIAANPFSSNFIGFIFVIT